MNRTLEAIRGVCKETPEGCWLWKGALIDGKYPQAKFPDGPGGKLVRRVAYLLGGRKLLGNRFVLVSTCDSTLCCNPAHLRQMSKARKFREEYEAGIRRHAFVPPPPRQKLTSEQVMEVRQATGTAAMLSKRYGISAGHVNRIRRGEAWRTRVASVFDLGQGFAGKVSGQGFGRIGV